VSRPLSDIERPAQPAALADLRALVSLATPIALAQLGLVTISLVDTAAVGRLSVLDLAGQGIGRSIAFGTTVVGIGMAGGLEPLAAQAVGAGEHGRAWQSYLANRRATLALWPLITVAALALTFFLAPLGVEPAVIARVRVYLAGAAPGFAAQLAYFSARVLLQAHGQTRPALIGSLVANLVNVPVVNLLVRGDAALAAVGLPGVGLPALGAAGAGIADSVSSCMLLAFVALPVRAYRVQGSEHVPLSTVLRLGLPVGMQMAAEVAVFSAVTLLTGALGADVASAHSIALGMASFTFMGALGVSGATSVLVGRAIGAGTSPRRAGLLGIGLGAGLMLLGTAVYGAVPGLVARAFTDDPEVVSITVDLLRIVAFFQVFDGIQAVSSGALRGAGDMRFPFLVNVVAHWLVGFPVAVVCGFVLHAGARGLWWGLTAGLVVVSTALATRFVWLTRRPIARAG
jgi:MATE family multidrug resistance protein